jgi:hypothetical protein
MLSDSLCVNMHMWVHTLSRLLLCFSPRGEMGFTCCLIPLYERRKGVDALSDMTKDLEVTFCDFGAVRKLPFVDDLQS